MARVNWFDEKSDLPLIDQHVKKLEHFTKSMADGVIEKDELDKQQAAVVAAMKAVERDLSDEQHEKVTRLLVEITAYNIMQVLHDLLAERVRKVFGEAPDE
jgi:predicted transcriptional regulator